MLDEERPTLKPTDAERVDRHLDYISCTIEYPNPWYFRGARDKERVFRDWVILFIRPGYLWAPGTLFCPRNAAAGCGTGMKPGYEAFMALFAHEVQGYQLYVREPARLDCCPTDNQAEVMIPNEIRLTDITGVCVRSEEQAQREYTRLEYLPVNPSDFTFIIAPALFDANAVSVAIGAGRRPLEEAWTPQWT